MVIVLVATGEAHAPATEAMALALRASLGGSPVMVREDDAATDDALAEASGRGVAMVASVRWVDDRRTRVAIRARVASTGAFVDRELLFGATDDPRERGRTVGLVLATLVPEAPVITVTSAAPPRSEAPPPPPAPERWSVDAAMAAALGVGGPGGGIGGSAGVRRKLSPRWSARAGARAWVGEVAAAQSSSRNLAGGLGVGLLLTPPARVGLEARLDALLVSESLAHFSQDDPAPVRRSRLQPGADLLAELSVRLSGGATLTIAGGTAAQAGSTDVIVHGARVAVLPTLRLVIEAGLRVRL